MIIRFLNSHRFFLAAVSLSVCLLALIYFLHEELPLLSDSSTVINKYLFAKNKNEPVSLSRTGSEDSVANKEPEEQKRKQVIENYGRLPLHFEPNQGQIEAKEVKFTSRGSGYNLFLTPTEAVLALSERLFLKQNKLDKYQKSEGEASEQIPDNELKKSNKQTFVRMQLIGSNHKARANGENKLDGKSNYFYGNDSTKWRTNIPNYKRVLFEEVYDGVDLAYYGNQRQLEYDFIVKPKADASNIKLRFNGIKRVNLADSGELILETSAGEVRQKKPIIYQEQEDGTRQEVAGGYKIEDDYVSFWLSEYDHNKKLIIDPVIVYSTFHGGSDFEFSAGIAIDSAGNAYITGYTFSSNFPLQNPRQNIYGGGTDAFITKLNAAGNTLVYSTYHGGSGSDTGNAIAVDSEGNAYTIGTTFSTNFPLSNARQSNLSGTNDTFITKLNAAGNAFIYSTYHGGSGSDRGNGISIDSVGNAYLTGSTASTNFPLQNARQSSLNGSEDAFITKINSTGNTLVYSTYHGGNGTDEGNAIAVDGNGNAYLTGSTASTNFPLQNARQSNLGGGTDAFFTKLNSTGTALITSTYLGGSSTEIGHGIAVNESGNAFITGRTESTNFPLNSPSQTTRNGTRDAFVTSYDNSGFYNYSTYLGGNGVDYGNSIAVNSIGNAYIIGSTNSTNFPLQNAMQSTLGGTNDAFITQLAPNSSEIKYSTYLGGSDFDIGYGIAVDGSGNTYVTGRTGSTNFPIQNANQSNLGGSHDAFILKLSPISHFVTGRILNPDGQYINTQAGFTINVSGRENYSVNTFSEYQLSLIPNENYNISLSLPPELTNHTITPTNYTFSPINDDEVADFTVKAVNDDFADAAVLTSGVQGTNAAATKEANEPDHAEEVGGKSVWYKWVAPSSGAYRFTADAGTETFRTLLGIYTGTSVGSLTSVDAGSGRTNNSLSFIATQGIEYKIAVDDSFDSGLNFTLSFGQPLYVSGTVTNVNGNPVGPVTATTSCNTGIFQQFNVNGIYNIEVPLNTNTAGCTVEINGLGVNFWSTNNGRDFFASTPTYKVSGTLFISGITSVNGIIVTLSGNNIASRVCNSPPLQIIAPGQVKYECDGLSRLGNYTVTPTLSGYTFEPEQIDYFPILGNQPNRNYTGSLSCPVTVSPTSQTFPASGGSGGPVTVNVPSGCSWTAYSSESPANIVEENTDGLPIYPSTANILGLNKNLVKSLPEIINGNNAVMTTAFTEGFDVVSPLPSGWIAQNNSVPVGSRDWFQGIPDVFPSQSGAEDSYIAANFDNVSGVGTISNWLLTPNITFNNGDKITFYTRTIQSSIFPDRLQVRLSTNGSSTNVGTGAESVGDFSTLLLDINPTLAGGGYPETFTKHSIIISGLAGPTSGRLAFRYYVTNGGGANAEYIGIDTFSYTPASTWITNITQSSNSFTYNVAPYTGATPRTGTITVETRSNSASYTVIQNPPVNNPVPVINNISPNTATAGGSSFPLTVNGSNFINGSVVRWNGQDRTTTFVSATQLTAQIPATDLQTAGTNQVSVFNPTPGGGTSNPLTFTVNNPNLSIQSNSIIEGNSGTTSLNFTVNLSSASNQAVTVNYSTTNGTATAGEDYMAVPKGTVIIPAGLTSGTATVQINGDTVVEPDENFTVTLSSPQGATITDGQGTATGKIINDDVGGSLQFSPSDFSVNEGDGNATVTITRTNGAASGVTVVCETVAGGSATPNQDYTPVSRLLTFDANTPSQDCSIPILNDSINEPMETVNLRLRDVTGGGTLGDPIDAVLTIIDNDGEPTLSINNVSMNEGNSGITTFDFTVSLSGSTSQTVTVNYETANETATSPGDYQTAFGPLSFAPGETSKTVSVSVNGDTEVEPDETFSVNLSGETNATISNGQGTGTILNDDNCSYSITPPTSQSFNASGGSGGFILTTSNGCAWMATTDSPSWINITSGGSATSTGTVSFSVGSNPGGERSGTITAGGQVFTVNQSAANSTNRTRFDMDGDGKTDIGIWRPGPGQWWYLRSIDNVAKAFQFGQTSDIIVPADFTGDGATDIAFWRPSTGQWFVLRSEDNSFFAFDFGANGDIPVPGDFDGDGKADAAVFRPSNAIYYIIKSSDSGLIIQQFGQNGDVPIIADYDGDGKADIANFRPSVAEWYLQRSTAGYIGFQFGTPNDTTPTPADFTGDGKADIAFFKPSASGGANNWFVLRSEDFSFYAFPFGVSTDIPVPGDYDGDGKADPAVFRPSNFTWYLTESQNGSSVIQFGIANDKPIPSAYIP